MRKREVFLEKGESHLKKKYIPSFQQKLTAEIHLGGEDFAKGINTQTNELFPPVGKAKPPMKAYFDIRRRGTLGILRM